MSSGYNTDEFIWNAEISKQILAGNRGTIRLQWKDILQQALNIRRNETADYYEDSQFNVLSSYVMLTFSYRFNQMGNRRSRNSFNQEGSGRENDFRESAPRQRGGGGGRGSRGFN